jgi:hydroxyacylglutathione hydrolase
MTIKVEQIYTKCLAQGAYFISSEGEAAVIDPLRDPQPYLDLAEKSGAKINYILETHFHADFVSGHIDLAKKTGASIVYGPGAETNFPAHIAQDGEIIKIGNLTIKVLHTPGHTLESVCYLLIDQDGKEQALFSGDTLFIGDVGRPDLAQQKGKYSERDLAGLLYDSLRNKIMSLPDDIIVYPAHGAGSACGKNMSKETSDTLGNQKKVNYALKQDMTKDEFINELLDGILPPPAYFSGNVMLNKQGYLSFEEIMEKGNKALSLNTFKKQIEINAVLILDTRNQLEFVKGFIPGSLFIGIDGDFAPWSGALINELTTPIVFIAPKGREAEVVMRLSRVGFDNVIGYLDGGFETWQNAGMPTEQINSISAEAFKSDYNKGLLTILDVRKPREYENAHLIHAINKPLDFIHKQHTELEKDKTYHIHCAGGYRSVIYASILKQHGFGKLINIEGGFGAIKKLELPLEVCDSSCEI